MKVRLVILFMAFVVLAAGHAEAQWNTDLIIGKDVQAYNANMDTDSTDDLVDTDFGSAGIMKTDGAGVYSILTDASTDWNAAYAIATGDSVLINNLRKAAEADSSNYNTSYLHSLLTSGNPHSVTPTELGLVIGTNVQAYDADLTTYAGIAPSANIQSFLGSADYAAARTNLGVAIGSDVQAYSANLTTYAGIAPSANIQSFLGSADYATARTNLGLVIGTNVLAQQTIGIANDNLVETDDASIAADDYAVFTANGIKGLTVAEVKVDLSLLDGDDLTDGQYVGVSDSLTAGESLIFGDIVYMKDDGKMWKAQGNAALTVGAEAIALGTISGNAMGLFLRYGYICETDWTTVETLGAPVYVDDDTAGLATTTKPTDVGDFVFGIGTCSKTDLLFFNPPMKTMYVEN